MSGFISFSEVIQRDRNALDKEYIGKVVDNNDPEQLCRIKVEIPGLYEGDAQLLPWVWRHGGGTSDQGGLEVPEIDSQVLVRFPDRNLYNAIYSGYLENESSLLQKQELLADYPETYGKVDSKGNKFVVNKKQETVLLEHSSGTRIEVDKDGNVTLTGVAKIDVSSTDAMTQFGEAGTELGTASSTTTVLGQTVALGAAGGLPVAVVSSKTIGITGTPGSPMTTLIVEGSSKVTAVK